MSSFSATTESLNVSPAIEGKKVSRFLPYIHNLRGVAILFVVGVHARGSEGEWVSPVTGNFIQTFFDNYEGNGTVMFMFIAGFLFQHLTHSHFSYTNYLQQKSRFIILPYLLISLPIILVRMQMGFQTPSLPLDFYDRSQVYQFFYLLFTGAHLAPFWFIATIILVYFSAAILHALDNPFFYRYIFPVVALAGVFTYRPQFNDSPVLAYVHYLPVYITGMWASFNKEKILSGSSVLLYILAGAYLLISLLDISAILRPVKELFFEKVLSEGRLVLNFYFLRAQILCFVAMLIFYRIGDKKIPFLGRLGEYSFGIYFLHFIFIIITRKLLTLYVGEIRFTLINFILYYLFIIMASAVSVYLIKKVTGRYSRFFIGS